MTKTQFALSLNGRWKVGYYGGEPYRSSEEPKSWGYYFDNIVPAYWEDKLDLFRTTPLHTQFKLNPMYTLQRYPQAGYVPDMALPNIYGTLVYSRDFSLDEIPTGRVELSFGGVQNAVSVWLNSHYLGCHEGYSAPFAMTVPNDALKVGENHIVLAVSNNRLEGYKKRPVFGCTSRAANECTGGIYGSVSLCAYPDGFSDAWVTVAPDCASFTVHADGVDCVRRVTVSDGGRTLASAVIFAGDESVTIPTDGFTLWSPDHPKRYTLTVESEGTTVSRLFGIRRLTADGMRLYLNGEPFYFRGICEHGYYPETVHPTDDKSYYRAVIRRLKELGFNAVRFHTWVPVSAYMEAADELGVVIEVETPNNTSYAEWCDIVRFCRRYTSPVLYSSGNEMVIDEDYIEHLRACAALVHGACDSLFSPMSAMRGIEYFQDCYEEKPFPHNPKRLAVLSEFCDVYNTYSLGQTSYESTDGDARLIDERNSVYDKPLLSHEICIQGTYCDLDIARRYRGFRIGDTELFSSVERHLDDKGLLSRAPLYYKTSCALQRDVRKHCFETTRAAESFAGYDFLGDIDHHWHTFGYCVGMMNEFYELKPGETVENVRRYNADTVLLADLPRLPNFTFGQKLSIPLSVSHYGTEIDRATLSVRIEGDGRVLLRREIRVGEIPRGANTKLYDLTFTVPRAEKPYMMKLCVTLAGANTDAENEWKLYAFPTVKTTEPSSRATKAAGLTVTDKMSAEALLTAMKEGKRVLLFGTEPFSSLSCMFQPALAGRTEGHYGALVADCPLLEDFPHDGYCSFQFRNMLVGSRSVVLDAPTLPFHPMIESIAAYKNARREAILFEYAVGAGKLLVCSLNLRDDDPAARYLKARIYDYAMSEDFVPTDRLSLAELASLSGGERLAERGNENVATNKNDITM